MLPFLQVSDVPVNPTISIVQQVKQEQTELPYKLPEPKPIEYTIVEGDSLTKIAEAQKTTVQRLWEKNTNLTNPDLINVGDKLIVPTEAEVLTARPLPVAPVSPAPQRASAILAQVVGDSSGNTYSYGYCTWHVKNLRPDLPNSLGNADTWYARYSGPKGTTPQVGAAAQSRAGMHVAYVTAVNGNQVTISEMNYVGWNVVSSRTTNASEFFYLY